MPRPLSVLDLLRVMKGESSSDAIATSVEMARLAEELDYRRIWFAEHHNTTGLASGSPEIMINHVANHTSRINLGAGGIMLPNQAPLKVVEVFRLLNALHPGRIDLGLGRAPGTDTKTAYALRRNPDALSAEDYPQNVAELLAYDTGEFPDGHLFSSIVAIPTDVPLPPVWLLGSSAFSGQLAAHMGLGFSFASHINRPMATQVMRYYRDNFQPSAHRDTPHAILAVSIVLGETEDAAQEWASILRVGLYQLISGHMDKAPTLEEALATEIPPHGMVQIGNMLQNHIVGTPESAAAEVKAFANEAGADEVMITSWIPQRENRELTLREFKQAWDAIDG
jgi:luciferase family oxidoreductase group 1